MNPDTTLLQTVDELSARVVTLELENRLLRQKLDQYIRHYFGGQRNEGLDNSNWSYCCKVCQTSSPYDGRTKTTTAARNGTATQCGGC